MVSPMSLAMAVRMALGMPYDVTDIAVIVFDAHVDDTSLVGGIKQMWRER